MSPDSTISAALQLSDFLEEQVPMVEDRLRAVEVAVGRLEESHKSHIEGQARLCDAMKSLGDIVQGLRDDANRARGAIWALAGTSGGLVLTGLLWLLTTYLN